MLNEFMRLVCGNNVAVVGMFVSTLLCGGIMIVLWLIDKIRNGVHISWKKIVEEILNFLIVLFVFAVMAAIIMGIGHLAKWIAGCL